MEGLPPEPLLLKKFKKSSFSYDEFFAILATRRNASAPGLNGIPYKFYKKCPKTRQFLFKIFHACLERCEIPMQWRSAQEIYIPKVNTPSDTEPSDFLPIALLNVEGKPFCSLISKRLEILTTNSSTALPKKVVWQKFLVVGSPVPWFGMP